MNEYQYEIELKCENCGFKGFYLISRGVPIVFDGSTCRYCGCYTLISTGKLKEIDKSNLSEE
jgi:hypothetical protein